MFSSTTSILPLTPFASASPSEIFSGERPKEIKHPMEVVSVGDIITVRVLEVDLRRGRIALTMRKDEPNADTQAKEHAKQNAKKTGDKRK